MNNATLIEYSTVLYICLEYILSKDYLGGYIHFDLTFTTEACRNLRLLLFNGAYVPYIYHASSR